MTLPNFLIIGAAKAGTTSLYEHFRAHPEIFMPRLKEARFFSYDGRGNKVKFPVQTLEEYTDAFRGGDGREGHRRGDAALSHLPRGGGTHPRAPPRGAARRLAAQSGRPVLFDLSR